MAARTIDGPGDGMLVTTAQAAAWLSLSLPSFRRLVGLTKAKKGEPPLPWLASWLKPVRVGKSVRWHWLDVVALGQVLTGLRVSGLVPDLGGEDDEDED